MLRDQGGDVRREMLNSRRMPSNKRVGLNTIFNNSELPCILVGQCEVQFIEISIFHLCSWKWICCFYVL